MWPKCYGCYCLKYRIYNMINDQTWRCLNNTPIRRSKQKTHVQLHILKLLIEKIFKVLITYGHGATIIISSLNLKTNKTYKQEGPGALDRSPESLLGGVDVYHKV